MTDLPPLTLTIVIPALNEEEAIGGTVRRCLAARSEIVRHTPVTHVELVVVSDGSTDRTAEIARGFPDVAVIEFRDAPGRPENRGYGAAIKAGWTHGSGDLLAFLDADGTCDPLDFVPLIRAMADQGWDVVLGSRMGPGSRMPRVRRIGNWLYAALLGLLAHERIADTASGMRVVRRRALGHLLPLPDRLHFTPAMSARALLEEQVTIGEVPIRYAERIGRSKLNVARDGLRFLGIILSTALHVRPSRLAFPVVGLLLLLAATLLVQPTALYLRERRLEEWMIYRLLAASLLGSFMVTLFHGTIVGEQIIALSRHRYRELSAESRRGWRWLAGRRLAAGLVALAAAALALAGPGVVEYVATGHVTLHWSRVVVASFLVFLIVQTAITVALLKTIEALAEQQDYQTVGRPAAPTPRPVTGPADQAGESERGLVLEDAPGRICR